MSATVISVPLMSLAVIADGVAEQLTLTVEAAKVAMTRWAGTAFRRSFRRIGCVGRW
jgi:hypothetical protein